MLHRTKCKLLGAFLSLFRAAQNEIQCILNGTVSQTELTVTVTVTLTLTVPLTVTVTLFKMYWFTFRSVYHKKSRRNPIQNALIYILFCVTRKKSENRAMGHNS